MEIFSKTMTYLYLSYLTNWMKWLSIRLEPIKISISKVLKHHMKKSQRMLKKLSEKFHKTSKKQDQPGTYRKKTSQVSVYGSRMSLASILGKFKSQRDSRITQLLYMDKWVLQWEWWCKWWSNKREGEVIKPRISTKITC